MSWLEKLLPPKITPSDPQTRRSVPEGLWVKCPQCETVLYKNDLEDNLNVCPKCGHHHRISARARLDAFLDAQGRYEIAQEVVPVDPLKFKDSRKYPDRIKEAMEATGETDALVVMGGALLGIPVVACCFEFDSWGARWARWWASDLFAAFTPPWNKKCLSSASPPQVVHACKRACCR